MVLLPTLAGAIAQLAVFAALRRVAAPTAESEGRIGNVGTEIPGVWPTAALDLLERAETRAREGDWQGFGEALEALRALLQRLRSGGD